MIKTAALLSLASVAFTIGCAQPQGVSGAGSPLARQAIAAVGGANWQQVKSISATAIVTRYDAAGAAFLTQEQLLIDVNGGMIFAQAVLPEGNWQAGVPLCGQGQLQRSGPAGTADDNQRIISDLRMMLVRVRGPLLFADGASAGGPSMRRLGGQDLLRLPISAQPLAGWTNRDRLQAMYLDGRTCLPRFLTSGGDEPGQPGTVTEYPGGAFRPVGGVAVPCRFDVYRIGEHALVGDQPVLKVELRNVRVQN
jgi:hypothetical protein